MCAQATYEKLHIPLPKEIATEEAPEVGIKPLPPPGANTGIQDLNNRVLVVFQCSHIHTILLIGQGL